LRGRGPLRDPERMRIGAAFEPTAAAFYRGTYPLEAMQRRGHEIVWPYDDTGELKAEEAALCDVIYVFRRCEESLRRTLAPLVDRGVGLMWDTDDDLSAIPKRSPTYKRNGGLRAERHFANTVRMARLAHVMTTTSETIRDKYARQGIDEIHVIENALQRRSWRRSKRHKGLIVGWIAGMEHTEDVAQLGLRATLTKLVEAHPDLHVESIGVDLQLPERYTRHAIVHFDDLPKHMAQYDIGLAPLCDIPFNTARSNIKVKEYAASGVPWLASPRRPYRDLGEEHGGLLVDDGDWEQAIGDLIADKRLRKKLGRNGKTWALKQTIDQTADAWEGALTLAAERASHTARAAV
jgi:hypothetical protein